MSGRTVRCPAKINVSLRVLGRRPDGYHELSTVFQAIDLWDSLRGEPGDRTTLACDGSEPVSAGEDNLVLLAAAAVRRAAGASAPSFGLRLHLRKNIPLRGGLGGGSSNAAGSLLLCRRLWNLPLDDAELARIGRSIGADVPFFLVGGTAHGSGRGDRIDPLPFAGERPLILGVPPFGLSTPDVFRRFADRLTLSSNGVSVGRLSAHKLNKRNDFERTNDLEAVVFEGWPELRRFRDALVSAGASSALLSGSGSCVYGEFGTRSDADRAGERLAEAFPGWRLLRTRTVDRAAHLAPPATETSRRD